MLCLPQDGETLLHKAAETCSDDVLKMMIEKGANIDLASDVSYNYYAYLRPFHIYS